MNVAIKQSSIARDARRKAATINGASANNPSTLSPFRYPGGKSRLRSTIIDWIRGLGFRPAHFVEPFAGGSSIGLAVAELDLADHVTLVEIDADVSAVWEVILNGQADAFANQIRNFKLDHASAKRIADDNAADRLSRAFRCLLLNRIARAGIMAPGAGWLKNGEDGKGIGSRWYPTTLAKRVESTNNLRHKITFIKGDGVKVLEEFANKSNTAAFVDPPYVAKGRGTGLRLYKHCDVDCEKLFGIVTKFRGPMVITYHRSAVVRRLADAAGIERHTVTVQTGHTRSKRELIMYKPEYAGAPK